MAARVWRQEGGAEAGGEGEKRKCLKMRLLHRLKMSNSKGTRGAGILHSSITLKDTQQAVGVNTLHISALCMKVMNHSGACPEEYSYALKAHSHI